MSRVLSVEGCSAWILRSFKALPGVLCTRRRVRFQQSGAIFCHFRRGTKMPRDDCAAISLPRVNLSHAFCLMRRGQHLQGAAFHLQPLPCCVCSWLGHEVWDACKCSTAPGLSAVLVVLMLTNGAVQYLVGKLA